MSRVRKSDSTRSHLLRADSFLQMSACERQSAGGRITVAFQLQFWGDRYGNFTDRYGVQWAMNCRALMISQGLVLPLLRARISTCCCSSLSSSGRAATAGRRLRQGLRAATRRVTGRGDRGRRRVARLVL